MSIWDQREALYEVAKEADAKAAVKKLDDLRKHFLQKGLELEREYTDVDGGKHYTWKPVGQ